VNQWKVSTIIQRGPARQNKIMKKVLLYIVCILVLSANRVFADNSIFNQYLSDVSMKLQQNWILPEYIENAHMSLIFDLDKEGYITYAKIVEKSGYQVFDESAIRALQKAEPFGKFPANSTKETLRVNYSFDTSIAKTDKMKEYMELSDRYFHNGDYNNSLKYINLAITEINGDEKAYFLYKKRSDIEKAMGNRIESEKDLAESVRLKRIADIKRVHYVKHLAETENSSFAYFYLASCYEQLKDYDNAILAIDKAISLTTLNNQYKQYKADLINKKSR